MRKLALLWLLVPAIFSPSAEASIRFIGNTIARGEVTPGTTSVWMCIKLPGVERQVAVIVDDDHDGIVDWTVPNGLGTDGLWVLVDTATRTASAVTRGGASVSPGAFPNAMLVANGAGQYRHVVVDGSEFSALLWIRPGTGVWSSAAFDGGVLDADFSYDGRLVFPLPAMQPAASAATPEGAIAGDLFVQIHADVFANERFTWRHAEVNAEHLAAASAPGTMSFGASVEFAEESDGKVGVYITRRDGWGTAASVDVNTIDGTARAGVHYRLLDETVSFAPWEIAKKIEVEIFDDTTYRGENTIFTVVLSNPAGTAIGPQAQFEVTLYEDDHPPVLGVVSTTTREGDYGYTEVPVEITLSGSFGVPIPVTWFCSGCDKESGGTLTFAPGERVKRVIARFNANTRPERDRTLTVIVHSPDFDSAAGTIEVLDDDLNILTLQDPTERESRSDVMIELELDWDLPKGATLRYETVDDTAKAGSDYAAQSGTVTFSSYLERIYIPLINDGLSEGDEKFTVRFFDVENVKIRRSSITVTITDDEPAPTVPILNLENSAGVESNGVFAFMVSISPPAKQEIRFHATTASGSATASTDFVPVDGEIVVPAGATTAYVRVTLIDDGVAEPPETVTASIRDASNATINRSAASATIHDDDVGIDITSGNVTVLERDNGAEDAVFTIELSKAPEFPFVLQYATSDGTATARTDYVPVEGTLTFAAGERSKEVRVTIIGDDALEGHETFNLHVATIIGNPRITPRGMILNDDPDLPARRRSSRH